MLECLYAGNVKCHFPTCQASGNISNKPCHAIDFTYLVLVILYKKYYQVSPNIFLKILGSHTEKVEQTKNAIASFANKLANNDRKETHNHEM